MFEQLSLGQHPRILFITCCDSRIDPNLITQTEPGELFIIRNIGNVIPPYGATTGAEGTAIEYAIQELVYDWLKYAEATRRIIKEHYQGYEREELLNATNVLTQIENLYLCRCEFY